MSKESKRKRLFYLNVFCDYILEVSFKSRVARAGWKLLIRGLLAVCRGLLAVCREALSGV